MVPATFVSKKTWSCAGFQQDVADPAAELILNNKERTALRWTDDTTRQNFRFAVLKAEGIYKFTSAHPLFFTFYQDGRSPDQVLAAHGQAGLELTFIALGVVFFINIIVMLFVAKRMITTKAPTLADF